MRIYYITGGVVTLLILAIFCQPTVIVRPKPQTVTSITLCYQGLYTAEITSPFYKSIPLISNNTQLLRLLQVIGDTNIINRLQINKDRINDGWGHPLIVTFKNMLPSNASIDLLVRTNNLVIWSAGENGSNEYGHGDDVVIAPSLK